ncbi:glycosyltransferase family protein [Paenibacillus sp. N1-5-1-14]|uniref:glycosyltransferase family protein n=1 Tax=Paenibacillus radicibacter TaxID=2972488 RepID=UPI002158D4FF|nr:glycosyltransferase family protein [Paenibacillus radicibacter]MCR8642782.1 glycosyltransferase family protein [Paenibacillus radicibacter]
MYINENAIAFILCVNNENLYQTCKYHISRLAVPHGFTVEIIPIYGSYSMTSGYNQGMRRSNAKYKVYIHQDTYIIHPFFIYECVATFQLSSKIGMIGIMGCKRQAPTGSWWEGKPLVRKYMAMIDQVPSLQISNEVHTSYEVVESIDGAFMATQVDVDWDEAIGDYHFYDASQSIRFLHAGHQIIIPRQTNPWVLHLHPHEVDWAHYYRCREAFLTRYRALLPLHAPIE